MIKKRFAIIASSLFLILQQGNSAPFVVKEWKGTELSTEYVNRIYELANVYGYVRYFYPNKQLIDFEWVKYLKYSLEEIETCQSTTDFHVKLQALFSPFCPHLLINDLGTAVAHGQFSSANVPFYMQEHTFNKKRQFVSKVKKIGKYTSIYPKADSLYHFNISSDLSIAFPMALSELPDRDRKIAQIKADKNIFYREFGYNLLTDYHARIANEIIRCNIVQHFYPYYFEDGLDVQWKQMYRDYFREIAACKSMDDYYWAVCRMMSLVKDTHASVDFALPVSKIAYTYARTGYPEIETCIYKDQLFVKSIGNAYHQDVQPGDRIIKVNGRDVEDLIKEKLSHISYSTLSSGRTKLTVNHEIFKTFPSARKDSIFELTIRQANGSDNIVKLPVNRSLPFSTGNAKPFIEQLGGDIYYVNLANPGLIKYKSFQNRITELNAGKGIIFDMRGYPNDDVLSIMAHLTDTILSSGNLSETVTYFPDHIQTQLNPTEKWFIAPAMSDLSKSYAKKYKYPQPTKQRIDRPCVFLVNAISVSFMETLLDMVKHYRLGIIVGENSAGTNGDVVGFNRLSFAPFTVTGYKFTNRDGSQHHGIGIKPDIYIENTDPLTDKQLEAAIKYLNEQ